MNKKFIMALVVSLIATITFARPGPGGFGGGHHGGPGMGHFGGGHHGGSFWGRGGRNFWPGFVGGVVGGALVSRPRYYDGGYYSTPVYMPQTTVVVPPVSAVPPVVTTPVVTAPSIVTQPVIVEPPQVVERLPEIQYQRSSVVVTPPMITTRERVWIEGHYEERVTTDGRSIRTWVPGRYEMR